MELYSRKEAVTVADKITHQIIDALTQLAAEPSGLPLYASKNEPGLFPNAASAKAAAQKCLADDLVCVAGTDTHGKTPRELYTLSEKGWEYLLAAVNPKQVLEDFVRVLESRQGEVSELLNTARRMADNLQGLKAAVARVLPTVGQTKFTLPANRVESLAVASANANTQSRHEHATPTAVLEATPATELAPAILAYLADHAQPTDCTLPELFRALSLTDTFTIGEFHDCLRTLYAEGRVSLPAWTGPLYALPEPQFALLIGHGIAYYASLKNGR